MSVSVGAGGYSLDTQNLVIPGTTFPGGTSPANDIEFAVQTFPVPDFPSEVTTSSTVTYVAGTLPAKYDNIRNAGNVGIGAGSQHWVFAADGGLTFPDGTVQTTAAFAGYNNEIHVSAVDGNDTTGNGDILNPVASITKALTLVSSGGRLTVIVHPGTYTENPTTSVTNTTIATTELTGANTQLNGTLTLGAESRVSGLKMNNLTISTNDNVYISNCTVDTQLIKSGSGYTEIINSELQCTSGCQFTGAGQVFINGNKIFSPSVSNASANVTIRGANQIVTPSVTAGVLTIENSVVVAASTDSNAITSNASSIITLANSFVLNSAGTSAERMALSGFYSILNVVYDKANSTLAAASGTGGSTNSIDYFQYINADRLILASGGDVVNSTGVSQLANRVEGSWNITTGTNTYSFTVPANGAYQLWVRCNIPNGIITYLATVSVTNTNVPVLGSQRAYNYTGGGSPILLVTMPTQIVGAEGTISTATISGTTNNVFNFVISNTSGETQTAYYGYTKI
jgi:hypothetical protein